MGKELFNTALNTYPCHNWALFEGEPTGLMMVCTGNICRSAMADQVAKQVIEQLYKRSEISEPIAVASSGISDEEHGGPIDRRARQVLLEYGWNVGSHRARKITTQDLQRFGLFLVMTEHHYNYVRSLGQRAGVQWGNVGEPRLEMFSLFLPKNVNLVNSALLKMGVDARQVPSLCEFGVEQGLWKMSDLNVPDPWYGGYEDFADTLKVIEQSTGNILSAL